MDPTAEEDREVRQKVWTGLVPVCFNLAVNEVTTLDKPRPLFMMLPRISYLTLVTAPVKEFFAGAAPAMTDELWFEGPNGVPMKWFVSKAPNTFFFSESSNLANFSPVAIFANFFNATLYSTKHYPIGVLFDMYASDSYPWNLTVHFTSFPQDQLLRCPSSNTVKSHFMNSLKEAVYVKHTDIKKINDLSMKESSDVWDGLLTNSFDRFWGVNSRFYDATVSFPVRIFRPDRPFIQLASNRKDQVSGSTTTLLSLVKQALPESITAEGTIKPTLQVLVQGVRPSLDTPLEWLAVNMSHPDNFLYIVVV